MLVVKAFVEVPLECKNYADVFLFNLIIELSNNISMNKHTIELVEGK